MAVTAPLPRVARVPVAIPVRDWLPWAAFIGVLMLSLLYLVGLEQGALSLFGDSWLHEFMHDGRHLVGFPCH